jgi:hypothetical protein
MDWSVELWWRAADTYLLLRARFEDPERGEDGVRLEAMRCFDYLVTEPAHYMSD